MTAKPARLLFRGLHALIWHPDDPNRQALERYLLRLGLTIETRAWDRPLTAQENHDLLFFDGDSDLPLAEGTHLVPRVALIGSEAPTRLEGLLNQEPASFLVKPIRPAGIYAAIAFAFRSFERRTTLERDLDRLKNKVRHRRLIVFAVLRLMRDFSLSEEEAFSYLRRTAMQDRTTIETVSIRLITKAGEQLGIG